MTSMTGDYNIILFPFSLEYMFLLNQEKIKLITNTFLCYIQNFN